MIYTRPLLLLRSFRLGRLGLRKPRAALPFASVWVLLGALLLPCLYLPALAMRFDFIDDGNLVYPAPPMPLGQRLHRVWERIVANQMHLGPIRPVLWAHWEAEADLLGGKAVAWRGVRLLWTMFAAGCFLWLLRELRIRPVAALLVTALAIWNPCQGEVWLTLTLSEGVAMPYALLALVCAVRATRSPRPGLWDLAGALAMLLAMGCKITFVALVPAQLLLRVAPDGNSFREGWQRHGRGACLLGLTVLASVAQYVYFKLHWHAGQYQTGLSWAQLGRMIGVLRGASSINFLWPGLLLMAVVFWRARVSDFGFRGVYLAGLVLVIAGVGIYLPLDGVSGHYSIPAAWGIDLWLAALLSRFIELPPVAWKRLTYGAVVAGLMAVAVTQLGRQDRFTARAAVLWQALETIEREAPAGTCLAVQTGPDLNIEEGIHLGWHLENRGRRDLVLRPLDPEGQPAQRVEVRSASQMPTLLLSGTAVLPSEERWRRCQQFTTFYWGGLRRYDCCLWSSRAP